MVKSDRVRHFLFKIRLSDRQFRDIEIYSGSISIGGRELRYSIVYDITERKQADKALQVLHKQLEQTVSERTRWVESRVEQLQPLAAELIRITGRARQRAAPLLGDDLQQLLDSARVRLQTGRETQPFAPLLVDVEMLPEGSVTGDSLHEGSNCHLVFERSLGKSGFLKLSVPFSLPETEKRQQMDFPANCRSFIPEDTEPPADMASIRVLLADDHNVMRHAVIRLLAGQPDIRVVGEAANGRQALELARQLHPDVAVMDVSMPEMDGIEATRLIKAEFPGMRVIGWSMFEDEHIARRMRDAGAEIFLSKTVPFAELLKAVYGLKQ